VEARALVHTENPADAADHTAHDAADHRAKRPGCALTLPGASLDAAGDALSLRGGGERHGGDNGSNSDKAADHDSQKCLLRWLYNRCAAHKFR
jgi:hypothetical protein